MSTKAIKEKIGTLRADLNTASELVKTENRDFTADEQTAWDNNMTELTRLVETDLPKAEAEEAVLARAANIKPTTFDTGTAEVKETQEVQKKFSFANAIRAAYGEKLTGLEAEMHQEGTLEMGKLGLSSSSRSIVVPNMIINRAVLADAGSAPVDGIGFVDGVYANTILGDLGVTRINAQADARLTVIPSFTTKFEGETDDAADGGAAVTPVTLTPKRIASYADFSMQLAMQHNESVEQAIRRGLQESVGAKVEYACFTDDTANGAWNELKNGKTAAALTTAADTVTECVLELIGEVIGNNHNRGNLGFAISNGVYSELYTAVLATGVSPLVANNMIMGLPFYISSQIEDFAAGEETLYYGNWAKVNIAQFGGLEITLDNLTQKIGGKDRLIVNSFWDMALAQDAAISVIGYTG